MNGVMELLPPPLVEYLHERMGLRCTPMLARALGLHQFHRLVAGARQHMRNSDPGLAMMWGMLNQNDITVSVNWKGSRADFTTDEPVIVVANHPHGILDGLVLMSRLEYADKPSKMLASMFAAGVPELVSKTVLIDPYQDKKARHRNSSQLIRAFRLLRQGGLLVAFPSGAVEYRGLRDREPWEAEWNPNIARLARITGARVIPAYISGGNSRVFHLLANAVPQIRTALMIRAFLARRGSQISVTFGPKITPQEIKHFGADRESHSNTSVDSALIALFQERCYALQGSCHC